MKPKINKKVPTEPDASDDAGDCEYCGEYTDPLYMYNGLLVCDNCIWSAENEFEMEEESSIYQ